MTQVAAPAGEHLAAFTVGIGYHLPTAPHDDDSDDGESAFGVEDVGDLASGFCWTAEGYAPEQVLPPIVATTSAPEPPPAPEVPTEPEATGKQAPKVSQRNYRLGNRDRSLLAFLIEHKVATIPMLHRVFWPNAVHESAVNNRLAALRTLGLVATLDPDRTRLGLVMYVATPAAYAKVAAGTKYETKRVQVRMPAHTLAVAEVATRLVSHGWAVTSEREIDVHAGRVNTPPAVEARRRANAHVPTGAYWVRTKERRSIHAPDLICTNTDLMRVFVEIELNTKIKDDLEDLMRGYIEGYLAGRVHQVWYFVPTTAKGREVERAVRNAAAAALASPGWAVHEAALAARTVNGPYTHPPLPTVEDLLRFHPYEALYEIKAEAEHLSRRQAA